MKEVITCIEQLRSKMDRHRKDDLKEYPTRTIFIDTLLESLGWDVRDPDDVQLEYPTIDGKSVDYVLKINRKPVLFIEAKQLNNPLTDMKAITQVVGYAANAGVDWCLLTNGINYKVYKTTEKVEAPEKLLFEVSMDPKESEGKTVQQIAQLFYRFSRDAMASGTLDEIGEKVFTTGKIRKALDQIFIDPPSYLIKLIRDQIGDEAIKPQQVKNALRFLWAQSSEVDIPPLGVGQLDTDLPATQIKRGRDYGEVHHIKDRPREVVELYKHVDKYCRELDLDQVNRTYLAKYIKYTRGKEIFCCVHLRKSGLRVWLKLDPTRLVDTPDFIRDVSAKGHWGVGDVELSIDSLDQFQTSKSLIQRAFREAHGN